MRAAAAAPRWCVPMLINGAQKERRPEAPVNFQQPPMVGDGEGPSFPRQEEYAARSQQNEGIGDDDHEARAASSRRDLWQCLGSTHAYFTLQLTGSPACRQLKRGYVPALQAKEGQ